jgi:acetyl esterase/lipase
LPAIGLRRTTAAFALAAALLALVAAVIWLRSVRAPAPRSRPAAAELSPSAAWAIHAVNEYLVIPDVTYLIASNQELKLDVYKRRETDGPQPTVIFMHGGYWIWGEKGESVLALLPWLEMGWNAVNVEYRLGHTARAPAAVEDCLCALRFVAAHAAEYGVDLDRIVATGESAGGHLALLLGVIPESEGLDRQCASQVARPRVAAVINWYGITDVGDVVYGEHRVEPAVQWMEGVPNREEIARRISPLTWVRPGIPPILSVHGESDRTVPYSHSARLHEALAKAGVPNRLVTIPAGHHGQFTREERTQIFAEIREFLAENGVIPE